MLVSGALSVLTRVARDAKGYQVLFRINAAATSVLLVVDMELSECSTALASPAVALQNLAMQVTVYFSPEPT
jgi:hypothetical protein